MNRLYLKCCRITLSPNVVKFDNLNQITVRKICTAVTFPPTKVIEKHQRVPILFSPSIINSTVDVRIFRFISNQKAEVENQKIDDKQENQSTQDGQKPKKQSKFKQFYSQYGPLFLVVHLTTVVMWIYFFFIISKQGYDITKLLDVFHQVNLMSKETVESIHYKIDNYKTESGWITGQDIKHFATAYMVYKVIAPFRYVVSIYLVRVIVKMLRKRGVMKG